jgi:hypothetical protein
MSRRADPARIEEARRAATRSRLIGDGVTEATAEAWIAAWDVQAAADGLEPGREYLGARLVLDHLGDAAASAAMSDPLTKRPRTGRGCSPGVPG